MQGDRRASLVFARFVRFLRFIRFIRFIGLVRRVKNLMDGERSAPADATAGTLSSSLCSTYLDLSCCLRGSGICAPPGHQSAWRVS